MCKFFLYKLHGIIIVSLFWLPWYSMRFVFFLALLTKFFSSFFSLHYHLVVYQHGVLHQSEDLMPSVFQELRSLCQKIYVSSANELLNFFFLNHWHVLGQCEADFHQCNGLPSWPHRTHEAQPPPLMGNCCRMRSN